jgi:dTDP-4-dehydrorhamnose reductase
LVFSGADAAYTEDDFCHPLNRYAQQKCEIENYLSDKKQSFVSRLPLLYGFGLNHSNFLPILLSKIKNNETVEAFVDEFRTPLSGMSAAAGLSEQIRALLAGKSSVLAAKILHFAGKESISRYQLAKKICEEFALNPKNVIPTKLKNHNLAKLRPADVSLDASLAQQLLNFNPPTIAQELKILKSQQL